MDRDQPHFNNLLSDAHRATVALDGATRRDGPEAITAAVSNGKRIHSQLLDYRRTARLTKPEFAALQHSLDLLRARLKFFGECV
jgi:hypothetical protein